VLRRLSLENFKSWRALKMRFAPVTGIFGTNSSGKSSILQALLLLKQTAESTDRRQILRIGGERCIVDFGSFRDIVHGRGDGTVAIELGHVAPSDRQPRSYRVKLAAPDGHVAVTSVRVEVENHYYEATRNGAGFRIAADGVEQPDASMEGVLFASLYGVYLTLPLHDAPEQLRDFLSNRVHYVGPLRAQPSRQQRWTGARPTHVGFRGEDALAALLAPTALNIREASPEMAALLGLRQPGGEELQQSVAAALKQLRLLHSFRVHELAPETGIFEVRVKLSPDSPEVLLTDVGVGVAQLFPVLVQCLYAPRGSTIILEQPELHLHPSAQSELADFFIGTARDRDLTLIIESHSEHLLRRLQRRIADESAKREEVALYFVTHDGRESHLDELQLDEYGNIRNWPVDFFGDRFGEVAAMSEAQDRRRLGA
jgi:predicted ATPase